MIRYYDRDGSQLPHDWTKSAADGSNTDNRVARTTIGDITVSTVWLGLDHAHGDGPPLIFETMIFGGDHDQLCIRYQTEEHAMRGHLATIDALREGREPDWVVPF